MMPSQELRYLCEYSSPKVSRYTWLAGGSSEEDEDESVLPVQVESDEYSESDPAS